MLCKMDDEQKDYVIPFSNMTKEEVLTQIEDIYYLIDNIMTKEEYLEVLKMIKGEE